jgi:hypothetical protein
MIVVLLIPFSAVNAGGRSRPKSKGFSCARFENDFAGGAIARQQPQPRNAASA